MSITFDQLKAILDRIKNALLETPKKKLFLEDIARAAQIDVKTAEAVHDFLFDLDAILFDLEVEREMRGKFIRYFPNDDDDEGDSEFEDEEEDEDEI